MENRNLLQCKNIGCPLRKQPLGEYCSVHDTELVLDELTVTRLEHNVHTELVEKLNSDLMNLELAKELLGGCEPDCVSVVMDGLNEAVTKLKRYRDESLSQQQQKKQRLEQMFNDAEEKDKVKSTETENTPTEHTSFFGVCEICNENENACITSCGHVYCQKCITTWLATNHFCPICRTENPHVKFFN